MSNLAKLSIFGEFDEKRGSVPQRCSTAGRNPRVSAVDGLPCKVSHAEGLGRPDRHAGHRTGRHHHPLRRRRPRHRRLPGRVPLRRLFPNQDESRKRFELCPIDSADRSCPWFLAQEPRARSFPGRGRGLPGPHDRPLFAAPNGRPRSSHPSGRALECYKMLQMLQMLRFWPRLGPSLTGRYAENVVHEEARNEAEDFEFIAQSLRGGFFLRRALCAGDNGCGE